MLESESGAGGTEPPAKGRMPRPERESQILENAEAVFARHGFEAASMEEVARRSGVDRALVYQYFGGKRELYEACFTRALNGVTDSVSRAIAGIEDVGSDDRAAREEITRRGIRAFFEFVRDHGDGWEVLFRAGWSAMGLGRDDGSVSVDILSWVVSLLEATYPHADPAVLRTRAAHLLGASWSIGLWWRKHGELTIEQITEQHKDFCEAVLQSLEQEG